MQRTSHALVVDGQVWLVDPVAVDDGARPAPPASARWPACSSCSTATTATARRSPSASACRYLKVPDAVPGTPFRAIPVVRFPRLEGDRALVAGARGADRGRGRRRQRALHGRPRRRRHASDAPRPAARAACAPTRRGTCSWATAPGSTARPRRPRSAGARAGAAGHPGGCCAKLPALGGRLAARRRRRRPRPRRGRAGSPAAAAISIAAASGVAPVASACSKIARAVSAMPRTRSSARPRRSPSGSSSTEMLMMPPALATKSGAQRIPRSASRTATASAASWLLAAPAITRQRSSGTVSWSSTPPSAHGASTSTSAVSAASRVGPARRRARRRARACPRRRRRRRARRRPRRAGAPGAPPTRPRPIDGDPCGPPARRVPKARSQATSHRALDAERGPRARVARAAALDREAGDVRRCASAITAMSRSEVPTSSAVM